MSFLCSAPLNLSAWRYPLSVWGALCAFMCADTHIVSWRLQHLLSCLVVLNTRRKLFRLQWSIYSLLKYIKLYPALNHVQCMEVHCESCSAAQRSTRARAGWKWIFCPAKWSKISSFLCCCHYESEQKAAIFNVFTCWRSTGGQIFFVSYIRPCHLYVKGTYETKSGLQLHISTL